jgi:flagellar hook-associated protein 2
MAGATFSGLASGLDTNLIVESLLVNRQRRVQNINERIDEQNTRENALTDLNRALTSFETILGGLEGNVFEKRSVSVSTENLFTAETTSSEADLGDYEITVQNLAQRSVATIGGKLSSESDVIGAGTFTLRSGTTDYAVNLTDGASTLADLRKEINDQFGEDLQANIIEVDPGQFQLVVSTKNSGGSVDIVEGAGNSELTGFSNATFTTPGVVKTQNGEDAQFTVDGIAISRESNTITDVINGVKLELSGESAVGEVSSLKITADTEGMISGLKEFQNGYNDVLDQITRLTGSDGALANDSSVNNLANDFRALVSRSIAGVGELNQRDDGSTGFTILAQLGFSTNTDTGKLELDEDDLEEVLTDNFDEVKNIFLGGSQSNNPNAFIVSNLPNFSGSFSFNADTGVATIDGEDITMNRNGSIFTFDDDSEYFGLILQANTTATNIEFDLSAGIANSFEALSKQYTSTTGIISDRKDSINSRKNTLEDDLNRAEQLVEQERVRLTRVFAEAEQAISTLQGLQSSLGAQQSFA